MCLQWWCLLFFLCFLPLLFSLHFLCFTGLDISPSLVVTGVAVFVGVAGGTTLFCCVTWRRFIKLFFFGTDGAAISARVVFVTVIFPINSNIVSNNDLN